jgi:protein CpxP
MDTVKKNKSLVSIIIFLLITNLAMLFFFIVLGRQGQRNSHDRDQNGISRALQNDVGFTKQQLDSYQLMRKDHMEKMHALLDELRKAKTDFYSLIYSARSSDSSVSTAAASIAEKQKTLDLRMFEHFRMVRSICTPNQLQKFDSTIKKVIIRMTSRPAKEGHGH